MLWWLSMNWYSSVIKGSWSHLMLLDYTVSAIFISIICSEDTVFEGSGEQLFSFVRIFIWVGVDGFLNSTSYMMLKSFLLFLMMALDTLQIDRVFVVRVTRIRTALMGVTVLWERCQIIHWTNGEAVLRRPYILVDLQTIAKLHVRRDATGSTRQIWKLLPNYVRRFHLIFD